VTLDATHYVNHVPAGDPVGWCVLLPGRRYGPDGPLLFFATQVALAHGWAVRQVWWDPEATDAVHDAEERAWVQAQLAAACEDLTGPKLVVAKSLGTLAAPTVTAAGWPAVWLTPVLDDETVAEAVSTATTPQISVIGEQDPFLQPGTWDRVRGTRLLLPGDHILVTPGEPLTTARTHTRVVEALDAWFAALPRWVDRPSG